jgi:DNA-binding LytR/AlgR family response regulator|tara:strand:- start:95525 stop:95845 length:321 start_codon:yes stop_codon:yes gene_type:complete
VNSTKGIYLKNNDHLEHVGFPDILCLKGENNYCTVYAKSGDYPYSALLKEVAAQLPKHLFIQSHRNYVVNINAVSGFEGNLLHIGNHKIPVGKTYREAVFNCFKSI